MVTIRKSYITQIIIIILTFLSFLFYSSCNQTSIQGRITTVNDSEFHWEYTSPESQGMSSQKLDEMKSVLIQKGTKKLLIIKNDKIVYEWFAPGWEDMAKKHYTASLAKSLVGGMSLLTALDDGYIYLDQAACNFIPLWRNDPEKSKITIRQLATHTSGLEDSEATDEELQKINIKGINETLITLRHEYCPGWKGQFWRKEPDPFSISRDSARIIFEPGTKYAYSNPGIAMLTYAVSASLAGTSFKDIRMYLKERIYSPIGIGEGEYEIGYGKTYWLDGLELVPSWGGGEFTAKAVARIGLLMLHKGNWNGKQLIDSALVNEVTRYRGTALPGICPERGRMMGDYRIMGNPLPATTAGWYSNYDGIWSNVPRDAFAGGGAGNQHLLVIPSLRLVVVRMGDNLFNEQEGESTWQGAEKYLFNPILDAIIEPPYPESNFAISFAPKESVLRLAHGGDTWPITWADDGLLYTAYGDGNGFLPNTDIKLSLGFAKVIGDPPSIEGVNIRSITGERVGEGKMGEKASGMLMVDGMLYMLVRNAQNAVLMWSTDHAKTWERADWKFDVSFGYPTFLNYRRNYEGATDNYVYIYSHDEASAYKYSDCFILARVSKDQIKDWRKYEYFSGYGGCNRPKWSCDIRKRMPVFTNPAKCYWSGIT